MKSCNKPRNVLFAAIGAALLLSCSNQGEGERCSTLTGNDDCETGLTCRLVGSLELCCPTSRAPSVPECIPPTAVTPDASTDAEDEAAAEDAAQDSTDASEEGSGL